MLTVFTQEQPDYIGLKVEDPFKVGGMEVEGSAEVVVAGSGLGVRVVDIRVETQPICTNSPQIELVPGGLRMLKKFLGTVSSWTNQV